MSSEMTLQNYHLQRLYLSLTNPSRSQTRTSLIGIITLHLNAISPAYQNKYEYTKTSLSNINDLLTSLWISIFIKGYLGHHYYSDIDTLTTKMNFLYMGNSSYDGRFWAVFNRNNSGQTYSGSDPFSLKACICSETGKTVLGSCSYIGHVCSGRNCACRVGVRGARAAYWLSIASFVRKTYGFVEPYRMFELFTFWYSNSINVIQNRLCDIQLASPTPIIVSNNDTNSYHESYN